MKMDGIRQQLFIDYMYYLNETDRFYSTKARYKYTPHGFSRLKCIKCGCVWVAHAEYVKKTINIEQQKELFYE